MPLVPASAMRFGHAAAAQGAPIYAAYHAVNPTSRQACVSHLVTRAKKLVNVPPTNNFAEQSKSDLRLTSPVFIFYNYNMHGVGGMKTPDAVASAASAICVKATGRSVLAGASAH